MANCCICSRPIEREDAPVLSMGAVGNARLLCDSCAQLLDTATLGESIEEISSAMDEIGNLMANGDPDTVTFNEVKSIMHNASERAKAIKDGSYDFSLDEAENDEGFDEIPEDMLESEEDIEQDIIEEEKNKKFNKVYNIILICMAALTVGFIIWRVIDAIFF